MEWLTTQKVADLYGVTDRTVRRQIFNGDFGIIGSNVKETFGDRNTKTYRISVTALPIDKQKQYYMDKDFEVNPESLPSSYSNVYTMSELKELHGSSFEKKLDEALRKREAIVELGKYMHGERDDGVKDVCDKYGFSKRSLYRYKKVFDEAGLVGLIKKPRKDRGESRLSEDAVRFIRGCYLQPMRPKVAHVLKMYNKKAEEMGWMKVAKDTIYREIDRIPEAEKCLALEGEKMYNAKYMPAITRTYDDLLINEYWVGDGHTLAIWTPENGRIERYIMSAWMDMRSRTMVGWCIAKNSNSSVIAAALRSGIERYGIPSTCYMDNGKDYKSGYLNADTKEEFFRGYSGVFKALDIKTSFAIPFNAKAKPIERFFETFSSNLTRYLVGFCGESIDERPHNLNKKEILVKGMDILDVSKFIEGYMEAYNNQVHGSLKGKTPMDIVNQVGKVRHDMPTDGELDLLMLRAEVKNIANSGIRKFGTYYWDDELIPHIGSSCVVRYDLNNVGELYVYVGGKLICKATNKELLSMNASEEDIKKWMKLKSNARKATKEALKAYSVKEDDVRRLMLEDYVDDEVLNRMLTPSNKTVVKKSKVVRMNRNTERGKEIKTMEEKSSKGIEFYEKLGEKLLQVK